MDVKSLTEQFRAERARPSSMAEVADRALLDALGPSDHARLMTTPVGAAVARLARAVDSSPPMPGGEPAYHNIAHFKEAVMAAAAIAGAEFVGPGRARMVGLATLAMVGHDLLHDGSVNSPSKPRSLEQASWEACSPHLAAAGLGALDMALAEHAILGTDPTLMAANRARYLRTDPAGPLGSDGDRLRAVANEADIAGSLLPGHGRRLGELLALEWTAAGIPMGRAVASWGARLGFLGFAATATAGARALGLESARQAQLAAFARLASDLGLPDAKAACAALDDLEARGHGPRAHALFHQALSSIDPDLASSAFPDMAGPSPLDNLPAKLGSFRAAREAPAPSREPLSASP